MPSIAHILTASDELHEVLFFLPLQRSEKWPTQSKRNTTSRVFLRIRGMTIVFMGLILQVLNSLDDSDIDISDFEIF